MNTDTNNRCSLLVHLCDEIDTARNQSVRVRVGGMAVEEEQQQQRQQRLQRVLDYEEYGDHCNLQDIDKQCYRLNTDIYQHNNKNSNSNNNNKNKNNKITIKDNKTLSLLQQLQQKTKQSHLNLQQKQAINTNSIAPHRFPSKYKYKQKYQYQQKYQCKYQYLKIYGKQKENLMRHSLKQDRKSYIKLISNNNSSNNNNNNIDNIIAKHHCIIASNSNSLTQLDSNINVNINKNINTNFKQSKIKHKHKRDMFRSVSVSESLYNVANTTKTTTNIHNNTINIDSLTFTHEFNNALKCSLSLPNNNCMSRSHSNYNSNYNYKRHKVQVTTKKIECKHGSSCDKYKGNRIVHVRSTQKPYSSPLSLPYYNPTVIINTSMSTVPINYLVKIQREDAHQDEDQFGSPFIEFLSVQQ